MSYTFNQDLSTPNFELKIDQAAYYGYFEHNELGDGCGGGLWFDPAHELVDYDGVFSLPVEVAAALKAAGYWGEML